MPTIPTLDLDRLPHELAARGQQALQRAAGTRVCICGAGALGASLAEHLARSGWRRLRVVDCDRVEARNLATQPYLLRQVGQAKTRALASLLYEACACELDAVCARIDAASARRLLGDAEVVVDALDSAAARRAVAEACRARGLPCLHLGLGGAGYAELRPDAGYRIEEPAAPEDPCAAPYTRSLVQLTVALAAEALARLLGGEALVAHELPLDLLWRATRAPFGHALDRCDPTSARAQDDNG